MRQNKLATFEYLRHLKKYSLEYQQVPDALAKITAVKETVEHLQAKALPTRPLPRLEFSETRLFDLLGKHPDVLQMVSFLNDLRECVIENFGIWHIFSRQWVNDLQIYLRKRPVLQVMAGNAVLASYLENTIATDDFDWQGQDIQRPKPWTTVQRMDAMAAVQRYYRDVKVIIMEWAPDGDPIDYQILRILREKNWSGEFIVIGEKNGATNSKIFWKSATLTLVKQLNKDHQPFDFIRDQVFKVE